MATHSRQRVKYKQPLTRVSVPLDLIQLNRPIIKTGLGLQAVFGSLAKWIRLK